MSLISFKDLEVGKEYILIERHSSLLNLRYDYFKVISAIKNGLLLAIFSGEEEERESLLADSPYVYGYWPASVPLPRGALLQQDMESEHIYTDGEGGIVLAFKDHDDCSDFITLSEMKNKGFFYHYTGNISLNVQNSNIHNVNIK